MRENRGAVSTQSAPAAADSARAHAPNKWAALGVLACGLALIVLDGTIVGVSMPTIIGALDLDLAGAQWVTSLYSVVFAALLLTAGKLGDAKGRRTLFLAGVALFVLGSVIAGLAGSAGVLIVARVVQGVGGAAILPSTLSSVNSLFQGDDRAAAFGVWGAVMAGAAAVGPLAGGLLTEYAGWRWIFWVNVPIGVLLFVLALKLVPNTKGRSDAGHDVAGFLLSAIGFGLLVFAIIQGPKMGWWPRPGLAGIVGAVAVAAFVVLENRRRKAQDAVLLDVGLFQVPTFTWGNITALMVAVGEFALVFVLPLYLINALGLSTIATGLVLAAMAAGAFLSGALARHLAAWIGASGTVLLGLGLEVFGVLQLTAEQAPDRPLWLIVVALVIYGVGLGLASAQLTSLVLKDVPVEQSGQGSATQSTVRQLGSALGAAMAGAMLSAGMAFHSRDLTGTTAQLADAARSSAGSAIPAMRGQGVPGQVLDPVIAAYASGTRWALVSAIAALVIGFLAAFMVSKSSRGDVQN